jgi:hypothetical protein
MAIENSLIATTNTSLIIVPSNKTYAITSLMVCNYSSVATEAYDSSFSVHVIKSGDTKNNTNMILNNIPLAAQDSFTFSIEKIILNAGDSIVLTAADNDRLSATLSYLEV